MKGMTMYGYIAAIIAVVAVLLFMYQPTPSASGSCSSVCTTETHGGIIDDSLIAKDICSQDYCLIKSVTYEVQGFTIVCECCKCVGDASLKLPDCDKYGVLGQIYKVFGRCI